MPVRVRSGGAWVGGADGAVQIRWNNAWITPNSIAVRWNGTWIDSGYKGLPAPPTNLGIYGWDYSNVALQWNAGAGGAPVASYEIVFTDVNGNWLPNMPITGVGPSPWGWYAINWDTRYRAFIRSKSTGGQYSGFVSLSGATGFGIGHPQQDTYGNVAHTRPWAAHTSGAYNAGQWISVAVPSSVTLNAIHWTNLHTSSSIGYVTPGTNRDVDWIMYNNDNGSIRNQFGNVASHNNNAWSVAGNVGNGTQWGIVAVGAGWSTTGNPTYQLFVDDLWVDGTETYYQNEVVSSIPAAGNYYW